MLLGRGQRGLDKALLIEGFVAIQEMMYSLLKTHYQVVNSTSALMERQNKTLDHKSGVLLFLSIQWK